MGLFAFMYKHIIKKIKTALESNVDFCVTSREDLTSTSSKEIKEIANSMGMHDVIHLSYGEDDYLLYIWKL